MTVLLTDIELGSYCVPDDAAPDMDATHRREGRVWAVERRPVYADGEPTGEYEDVVHVVRHHRNGTHWATLPVERIGSVEPPNSSFLRSTVKGMARTIAEGTKLPHDVEKLADALGVFVRAMRGTR